MNFSYLSYDPQLFVYIWVMISTVCLHLKSEFQLFVYILIENKLLLKHFQRHLAAILGCTETKIDLSL